MSKWTDSKVQGQTPMSFKHLWNIKEWGGYEDVEGPVIYTLKTIQVIVWTETILILNRKNLILNLTIIISVKYIWKAL
jgi:hypothetical protein